MKKLNLKRLQNSKLLLVIISVIILVLLGIAVSLFLSRSKSETLTDEERAAREAHQAQINYLGGDKITDYTPYNSYENGYKITSEQGDNKIIVNIYLYTCDSAEIDGLKTAALKYLTDNNLKPSDYDIKYSNC